jgi:hypothetical protein
MIILINRRKAVGRSEVISAKRALLSGKNALAA